MIAEACTDVLVRPFGARVLGMSLLLAAPLAAADGIVAVGAANGSPPRVQVFEAASREPKFDFLAYHQGFHGGVNVGVGDVDGDGAPDIVTAAGPGGAPHVRVYDGRSGRPVSGPSGDFMAFAAEFRGGVTVATGDVDGDGKTDIITGVASGAPPRVRVFSGADGSVLADFLAFEKGFRGGVRVAAGDFRHRMVVDLIVATGAGTAPRVRIFSGDGKTLLADRTVFPTGFRAGVSVGSGDLDHDGTVDLVVGTGSGGQGRVKVFSGLDGKVLADLGVGSVSEDRQVRVDAVDADGDHFDDLLVGIGTRRAPAVRVHRGGTWELIRTYRAFGSGFAGTPSAAGSVEHGRGTNYALAAPVTHEIPVIRRLYQYLPIDAAHPEGQYVPILGTLPANKHVYVITHGWAPGYRDWVNQYIDTHVLKWWETAGYNNTSYGPPDPDTGPASVWMFESYTQDSIPISPNGGLAQQLTVADPDALVLAYSWLDDSATTAVFDGMIPQQAYLSEALTNVNGMRLAAALLKALGPNYDGKIHLLGHSHGSKVATLAALALYQSPNVTTRAQQLTIFDSPESEPPDELSATNFLWNYFQQLPIGQTPASGFFVDNYLSAFGTVYGRMDIDGQRPLGGVVDTQLYAFPYSLSYLDDPGAWHSYPPAWYAQASVTPCNDGSTNGGLAWSPLLGNAPDGMANEWEQSWTPLDLKAAQQPCLITPFFTLPPSVSFDGLLIADSDAKQAQPVASITLGLGARQSSIFNGSYQKNLAWSGIAFDYAFSGPDRGILQIQINDYLAYYVDSAYVPAGSTQHVTMNIGYPSANQGIAITLLPPPGVLSTAQVTLSNFKQFKVSLLDEGGASADEVPRRAAVAEAPKGKP